MAQPLSYRARSVPISGAVGPSFIQPVRSIYNMDPTEAIEAACNPDKTKALFMGECGISWTTFKDVQRAILEQARLNMGWRCSGCGSTKHILWIRDNKHISCCPERRLVPPPVMYEDQLPEMTDEEYSMWFADSCIVDGVRMGPIYLPNPKS